MNKKHKNSDVKMATDKGWNEKQETESSETTEERMKGEVGSRKFLSFDRLLLTTFYTALLKFRGQIIPWWMRTVDEDCEWGPWTRTVDEDCGWVGVFIPHVFQQVTFSLVFKVQSGHLLRVSVFELLRHFDL